MSLQELLSIPVYLSPRTFEEHTYFVSNREGYMSLYRVANRGGKPDRLLPAGLSIQNPGLLDLGHLFDILEERREIILMLDHDGDETYQPHTLPLGGGTLKPLFSTPIAGRNYLLNVANREGILSFYAYDDDQPEKGAYWFNLQTGDWDWYGRTPNGIYPAAIKQDQSQAVLIEQLGHQDFLLYLWDRETKSKYLIYGLSPTKRGSSELPASFREGVITADNDLILVSTHFVDAYGPVCISPETGAVEEVELGGIKHTGLGEMDRLSQSADGQVFAHFTIDGASIIYRASYDRLNKELQLHETICGEPPFHDGVLQAMLLQSPTVGSFSFSSAALPSQLYNVGELSPIPIEEDHAPVDLSWLSAGEDKSFFSHDGMKISARLYRPHESLGFTGPRPVIYYIHGGPQTQERPDFTWFSMPAIQWFTKNGFSVFVPNVRGSTGYGEAYCAWVTKDWGGQDRLDHVHAHGVLKEDPLLDMNRAGVMGRSYGGYMTMLLASRHPNLFKAAVEMFGPYDLIGGFFKNMPDTHKIYFRWGMGDPDHPEERQMLVERSPSTYMDQLQAPLLVIQGRNDPRVLAAESEQIVRDLKAKGKDVRYLCFEDEGHDVVKLGNKRKCFEEIVAFFKSTL